MAAPTRCPWCDALTKKILDLEKVISTLRQIKNDEELLDTLFAASQLEATQLRPRCPPAEPMDETSRKPSEPAMTIAEEDLPRGGLTSTAASPRERPPRSPLHPSTPRKITWERPRRRVSPPHQAPLEAVILGTSMVRHLAKHTENYCFPSACVSDIAAVAPGILRNYPTSETVVVHCGSNDIAREQSEQLEVDFKNLINILLETGHQTVISGPLPSPSFGEIAFSRIQQLHIFLKGYCNMLSIPFIDNFGSFWKRKYLFARDGRHLNRGDAELLDYNIGMTLESQRAMSH
ncbi:hypothetical protein SKAU_G00326540 [Synaphobranchus kaupii]|uniref:SGNH hydrolase-type esterase domain-containing protein n=1 Tax=Synaphobranchus kaupii TaxID=118154 RepID=A0A9Q1EPY1_SYNKA|nr:hypothetical protein SKAU_G00326540 [Synaphobranchus kaupii]